VAAGTTAAEPGVITAFKLGVTTAAQTTVHVDGALHIAKQTSPLLRDTRTLSSTPNQQATHIVLAEDNAVNALIAKRFLRNLGYRDVTHVENGQAAVEAVQRDHVHLVLMDCQMPVMDGYEATRRIRALPDPAKRAIPIIALTASALQDDVQRCMAAGMNAHLAKPYDISALGERLNALLPVDERCEIPSPRVRRSVSIASTGSFVPSDPACGDVGPQPPSQPQPAQTGNSAVPRHGGAADASAAPGAASFGSMASWSVHGR
jgi:CheY-like chemotaxis protein